MPVTPPSAGSRDDATITVLGPAVAIEVDEQVLEPGASVGRFVIVDELGFGGMGVVYAAHDPELRRTVALKLLRHARTEEAARLQREAQAMAQLSHPNVITIYEVGMYGEQIFIAMEFVEGKTLRAWLRAQPRTWREIRDVFLMAGRGLAAAHAAGLVHRDVKPSNILVGADGRVRVMDFGLAYAPTSGESGAQPVNETISSLSPISTESLTADLTETGKIMGTPAYMSPQQHVGRPTDPRSDQYSFCVSMFEALHGYRPFAGDSPNELKRRKWTNRMERPNPEANVPAWLQEVLDRGLSLDPEKRWPSMDALLHQLARDPARGGRRLAVATAGLLALAVGWFGLQSQRSEECTGAEEKLEGVWDAEQREQVRQAMLATDVGYAASTWERVAARLDDYGTAWVREHESACVSSVRHEQSTLMLDRRMACLDDRLGELRALVDVLGHADEEAMQRAVSAAGGLKHVGRCSDVDFLSAAVLPPADAATAEKVAAMREQLAQTQAHFSAGQYDHGTVQARALVDESEAVGYEPFFAEASLTLGLLLEKTGEYDASAESLRRAYFAALAHGDDRTAAEAASSLVLVVGAQLADLNEGRAWEGHARAELVRAGNVPRLEARLHHAIGFSRSSHGDFEEALANYERALELRREFLPEDHPDIARDLLNVGSILGDMGRTDESIQHYERALEIWRTAYGPGHPNEGAVWINLGVAMEEKGRPGEAAPHYRRALEILEASLGPDHPNVAMALNNLGALAESEGKWAEARERHERALEVFERTYPEAHPMIVMSQLNLGACQESLGKPEQALEHFEIAVRLASESVASEHPYRIGSLTGEGRVLTTLGRMDEAYERYEQLLELGMESAEETSAIEGVAHYHLGRITLDRGSAREALPHLRKAVQIRTAAEEADEDAIAEATAALSEAERALQE
jgi:tetratricopeptide (TPR) repeat protein/tRNA A-37 threonylcarbamoyl transferase component Bud32